MTALQMIQKKLTPNCWQCPSEDDHFATFEFADDNDLLGGSEELHQLTERLERTAAGYSMEVALDKSKILVNNIKPRPPTNIWMNGKRWKKWTSSNT